MWKLHESVVAFYLYLYDSDAKRGDSVGLLQQFFMNYLFPMQKEVTHKCILHRDFEFQFISMQTTAKIWTKGIGSAVIASNYFKG